VEDIVAKIAEAKIQEAMGKGEFDNLPGKGKPLALEDSSMVPEEMRAAYVILKNAGYLPEELELKKEITSLRDRIKSCGSEEEKSLLKKKLLETTLKHDMLMESRMKR